jgi:hypothetical protein
MMRTLVFIAGLSLLGSLPGGIAAADEQTLAATCSRPDRSVSDSDCSNGFALLGVLRLANHDYDRAIADLDKALQFNPNNAAVAPVYSKAIEERARQAHSNSPSAASEAQDAPPQQAPRQAEKQPGPTYNPNDEIWRQQQESDAEARDRENREQYERNDRAEEESREAQRQLQYQQEEWEREQQERERQEYQQRQDGD